ncbi:hypothetical protein BKA83DRAFT_4485723 [Pisolithus microcarpus]|nr:hypothetical protein BKA83DRAFT_4485723 [Pisolithus microcarpus]
MFTLETFYQLLTKWIAVNDQSINVVECPEFHELLYLGMGKIDKKDLLHHTKLTTLLLEEYKKEHQRIVNDLKVCMLQHEVLDL